MLASRNSIVASFLGAVLLVTVGCNSVVPATTSPTSATSAATPTHSRLTKNMLIFITDSGQLRYWPIDKKGGRTSYLLGTVTGAGSPSAMAANGNTIAIAIDNPPGVVLYDSSTGMQTTLPDSSGHPVDVAYDKQGDILALNGDGRDVVVYAAPQFTPSVVQCNLLGNSAAYVAADREGDIFINQQISSNSNVVEIPKGPKGYEPRKCSQLPIYEEGYAAGLLVDPKTDALVVFHDPDECAGGNEAEMDVYGKPYGKGTSSMRDLHGNCAQILRFGPDIQHVFFTDGSPTLRTRHGRPNDYGYHITQRVYPSGAGDSEYRNGHFAAGMATIPNQLPN